MGSSGNPLQSVENATTFGEFHRRLWKGEVTLAEKQMKTQYGRVHLERLLHNMKQARFNEAVKIVSSR